MQEEQQVRRERTCIPNFFLSSQTGWCFLDSGMQKKKARVESLNNSWKRRADYSPTVDKFEGVATLHDGLDSLPWIRFSRNLRIKWWSIRDSSLIKSIRSPDALHVTSFGISTRFGWRKEVMFPIRVALSWCSHEIAWGQEGYYRTRHGTVVWRVLVVVQLTSRWSLSPTMMTTARVHD